MRHLLAVLLTIGLTSPGNIQAQDFTVPTDYQLNSKEDYAKYEQHVIGAARWLTATPLNEQPDKRREVSAFLFKWINGSPTVNVEINPTILDFEKRNEGMLIIYMASSAKFVLENNYSKDMRAKHKAALRDLISVYKSGKGIQKDKKMERLVKAVDEGKLDEWVENNLKFDQRH